MIGDTFWQIRTNWCLWLNFWLSNFIRQQFTKLTNSDTIPFPGKKPVLHRQMFSLQMALNYKNSSPHNCVRNATTQVYQGHCDDKKVKNGKNSNTNTTEKHGKKRNVCVRSFTFTSLLALHTPRPGFRTKCKHLKVN